MTRPIVRTPLETWLNPTAVFNSLYAHAEHAFWLDLPESGDRGAVSYLGQCADGRVVTSTQGTLRASDGAGAVATVLPESGTVFDFLRSRLNDNLLTEPDVSAGDGIVPGWVGWFGYELGEVTSGVPMLPGAHPDAAWMYVDRAFRFEHSSRQVTLLSAGDSAEDARLLAAARASTLPGWYGESAAAGSIGAAPIGRAPIGRAPIGTVRWHHSDADYLHLIDRCKELITAGSAYVLCLTNQIRVAGDFDPFRVFMALRKVSPSTHSGLIRFGGLSLVSASPEQFLEVTTERLVRTRPIKGTRPRSTDAAEDARLAAELAASAKERAENLMIVDLMRNDLERIAAPGTVRVESLFQVESYAQVHQLVSTITAQLADDASVIDVIEATFPAGSMTGAPKHAAMTRLQELEQVARGVYSGAFGVIGCSGRIELAMVIRSILLEAHRAVIGAGGGITALSVPLEELEEVKLKAQALLGVLDAE
ncbi:anthranilate synthase component I family protein [Homoserinimonas sp. OAct 916]|uniref:anthranilate synthase component I family protein n=1 Tax=Homoserinimonas sp. OAct 916 TaxID=2211450 RepID=UPI000DBEA631|nr:anthranilate synthase component I family protein [Homoserinimonas sp. OAct 916]